MIPLREAAQHQTQEESGRGQGGQSWEGEDVLEGGGGHCLSAVYANLKW